MDVSDGSSKHDDDENLPEAPKNPKKQRERIYNLKKSKRKKKQTKRKIKVFQMTQSKLDAALEVLRAPNDVPRSTCYGSDTTSKGFPLLSYNRILREMQNCVEKQDWALFTKYMLRLGTRQTDDHFYEAHLRMAILGLTFDPVARKAHLLHEFIETIMKHWHQQGVFFTPEEATKMFFTLL